MVMSEKVAQKNDYDKGSGPLAMKWLRLLVQFLHSFCTDQRGKFVTLIDK
jgi:hypothetical protein